MSVAFSPIGKHLASGSADRTVQLWDTETGQHLLTLKGHNEPVRSVRFSPNGKQLLSCGNDGKLKLWDTENP
jgi:WD40 repeat protein